MSGYVRSFLIALVLTHLISQAIPIADRVFLVLALLCAISIGAEITSYIFSWVVISLSWIGISFIYVNIRMVVLAIVGYYGWAHRARLLEYVVEKVDLVQSIKQFIERVKYATRTEKIMMLRSMDKRAKARRHLKREVEREL